jgi:hypothetical protein
LMTFGMPYCYALEDSGRPYVEGSGTLPAGGC